MLKIFIDDNEFIVSPDMTINELENMFRQHIGNDLCRLYYNIDDGKKKFFLSWFNNVEIVYVKDPTISFHNIYNCECIDKMKPTFTDNEIKFGVFKIYFRDPKNETICPLYNYFDDIHLNIQENQTIVIRFECLFKSLPSYRDREQYAIKIGIDDINAVTGSKWQLGKLSNNPQNYIVFAENFDLHSFRIDKYLHKFKLSNICKVNENDRVTIKFEVFKLSERDNFMTFISNIGCLDHNYRSPEKNNCMVGSKIVFFSNDKKDSGGKSVVTLRDLGYKNDSKFYSTKFDGKKYEIIIKTLTGAKIDLDVMDSLTISELKEILYKHPGIPRPRHQKIVLKNSNPDLDKVLDDNMTLFECGINSDSDIYFVATLGVFGHIKPFDKRYWLNRYFTNKYQSCEIIFGNHDFVVSRDIISNFIKKYDECNICMVNSATTKLQPCNHVMCPKCHREIDNRCPFCRNEINKMESLIKF